MLVKGRVRRDLAEALPGMRRYGAPRPGGFSPRSVTARASRGRVVSISLCTRQQALFRLRVRKKRVAGCHLGPLAELDAPPRRRAHHPLSHLRHTATTLMLLGGVPVNVDLERIGKSNMGITLSIYTHALPVRRRTPQQFWIGCWVKAYWLTDSVCGGDLH